MRTRLWFSDITTWHLLLAQCFVSHVNLNVNQCYFLWNWKNNLAPWKSFVLLFLSLASACLSVSPFVLLPTHERLAWPPPVPSRHQLIYQNTWTRPVSFAYRICHIRPSFCYTGLRGNSSTKHTTQSMVRWQLAPQANTTTIIASEIWKLWKIIAIFPYTSFFLP